MKKCGKDGSVVVFVAATNRLETLDPTFVTSCWFLEKVHVGKPNEDSRRKIFGLLLDEHIREEDKEAIHSLVVSQTPDAVWGDLDKIAMASLLIAKEIG